MPYKDKEQQKEFQRLHYLANKNKYAKSRKANRDKRDIWFRELKSNYKCQKCNFTDIRCLDFHHKNPNEKSFGISLAVKNGMSESKILKEIAKCEVLCSNCHIKEHWAIKLNYHRNAVTKNLTWLRSYKSNFFCCDCGTDEPEVLSFHHKDENEKYDTISSMSHRGYSVAKLLIEIAKCEVVCFNCHRIRHNGNVWLFNSLDDVL